MLANLKSPKVYRPVFSCIYCGNRRDLSDEHIIAESLNGAMILKAASCAECRDITSRLERTCSRTIFGPFRLRHGFRTKRKHSRPMGIEIEIGNKKTQFISISGIPDVIFFLKFNHVANILLDAPDIDTSRVTPWITHGKDQFIGEPGWVVGKFDAFAFARMLVKIAHSFAVAELGINSFCPLALDFMFSRTNNLSRFVGGSANIEKPEQTLHSLRLQKYESKISKRQFVVVSIRLFACLGAPTYHVAIGEIPSMA